jgi:hypothetical protein
MAEGGAEFGRDDPDLDYQLDHDDDDDDEQEVNRTQPFQPGASSTPRNGGERMETQTIQHEQSGLPSSEEIPLLGDFVPEEEKESLLERARGFIRKIFPRVDLGKLGPIGFSKKAGNENTIVSFGPRGGESKIFREDGSGLLKSFTDSKSSALGPRAEDIIVEDRDTIQEMKRRQAEAVNELKQAETLSSQIDEKTKEMEVLEREIEHVQSRIDAIHDKYGSNLDMEAEVRRLEQQKKNYETDLLDKKKELASLQKQAKNIDKIQSDIVRLGATISEKE